jgi:uncharacterized protein (DUF362 family)
MKPVGEDDRLVAIIEGPARYPTEPPFHPERRYPEYLETLPTSQENGVYGQVRELLAALGLDSERHGTADWNPLGGIVRPGDSVVIKPNLIREARERARDEWLQVVTHGSVVRAIVDYVIIALEGAGRILIVDGPQTDSSFPEIIQRTGLESVRDYVRGRGIVCELMDLRRERWVSKDDVLVERLPLAGDPAGYVEVPLDEKSEFASRHSGAEFYGADYDVAETASYHTGGRHRYVMCKTVMAADVVIDVPKLKTHKKTGVTLCLKNMVGVNGLRNCLPHFAFGSPETGGDEFPPDTRGASLQSRAVRVFKSAVARRGGTGGVAARMTKRFGKVIFGSTALQARSGNWHGNDTAWRMVLDVNKALFGFDALGEARQTRLKYFCVVDGIVGGEGDGPSDPDPVSSGLLVGGANPVAVDTVATILMGFDDGRIPVVAKAWEARGVRLADFEREDVECLSNRSEWCGDLATLREARHLAFRPHFGWRGHIEREGT